MHDTELESLGPFPNTLDAFNEAKYAAEWKRIEDGHVSTKQRRRRDSTGVDVNEEEDALDDEIIVREKKHTVGCTQSLVFSETDPGPF